MVVDNKRTCCKWKEKNVKENIFMKTLDCYALKFKQFAVSYPRCEVCDKRSILL